jgi:1-acyl-sn-glycerol-3-phosphate acyltransferase
MVRKVAKGVYRIHVKNEHRIPEQTGYIICANHVSNFDYLYLTMNFQKEKFSKFCCMAKKDLFNKSAISKKLAEVCGMVPVDRGGINCEIMRCLKEKLKDNWGVLIHPEGTRSTNGKLGKLKDGAAMLAIEAGVPVVPAYINGAYEIYPKGKKLPNLFNWKKMRRYQVEVVYGEPISSVGLTTKELTEKINQAILNLQKLQLV